MTVKRLTETGVAKIKPPIRGRIDVTDETVQGLNLRVTSKGTKSWCYAYRYGGKQVRMTLGRYPDLNLLQARQIVKNYKIDLAMGHNPVALYNQRIAEQIEKEQATITVTDLSAMFIEKYVTTHHKRAKETIKFIHNHILPVFGNRPAKDIKRRDVIQLLDELKASTRPSAANHVLIVMRKMYNWAIERDELDFNPCSNIKKPVPIKERERVLSKHEISDFWSACNKIGYPYGQLCQILLLTGQRCNEIATLKWSYVDESEKVIRIPAENIKAGRGHDIPISDSVLDIFRTLPRFTGPYIFTTIHGLKFVSSFSKTKKHIEQHFNPKENWRFHDLRRTCATNLAELGVPLHTISRILNHAEGGVTKIYARHSYLNEKRAALDLWASEIGKII